jgi:hypothetical protein
MYIQFRTRRAALVKAICLAYGCMVENKGDRYKVYAFGEEETIVFLLNYEGIHKIEIKPIT